jgi:hypothetical protein
MLLLPILGGRFTDKVTDIFTTALPMQECASSIDVRARWGTGDIGFQ